MPEITSRILKTENVKWRDLKPIQGDKFKDLPKEAHKKIVYTSWCLVLKTNALKDSAQYVRS